MVEKRRTNGAQQLLTGAFGAGRIRVERYCRVAVVLRRRFLGEAAARARRGIGARFLIAVPQGNGRTLTSPLAGNSPSFCRALVIVDERVGNK